MWEQEILNTLTEKEWVGGELIIQRIMTQKKCNRIEALHVLKEFLIDKRYLNDLKEGDVRDMGFGIEGCRKRGGLRFRRGGNKLNEEI